MNVSRRALHDYDCAASSADHTPRQERDHHEQEDDVSLF